MKDKTKKWILIGILPLLTIILFAGIQSHFHHKEIHLATEHCEEVGGKPVVDKGFLALNYSFSCKISK